MKNTYTWILAIVAGLSPCLGWAQTPAPAETLSVEQVIGEVVRNNDRLKAAAFMEEAARREIGPAGAWDDPMLMLGLENVPSSVKFNEEMMTMKVVGLSQKIPYAGEKGLLSQSKRSSAEAAHESRRDMAVDLVSAARMAYAKLYYHRRLIDDLEIQRALYEQVVSSAQSRVTGNLAGLDELAAAHAALWRSDAEILKHENDAHTAYLTLCGLRGTQASTELPEVTTPAGDAMPGSADAWIDSAYAVYAPLRQLSRQAESFGYGARAAGRMSWPMLELGASVGFRQDLRRDGETMPQDNMISARATLSLPIFAGRQQKQMAASMRAMQRERESEEAQLRRDIEAMLRTLFQRAQRSAESVRLFREQIIPAAEVAFESARHGYVAGRISLPDLLTYAVDVYKDRVMAREIELEHERTLIEARMYTTNGDQFLEE